MQVEYVVLRASGRSNIIIRRCKTFQEAKDEAEVLCERSGFLTEYVACSLVHGEVERGETGTMVPPEAEESSNESA